MREVIDEKPVTSVVVGEIFEKDGESPDEGIPPPAPNEYHINAILDVDGNGTMELVVDNTIHEGISSMVFSLDAQEKLTETMYCGCGL
ncbi:MAG: hypothetical protein OEZ39_16635 [Gammaproteobacteria bacterium]|nr:hypothetical protein [Gammaproteobacteria bacterium]MDH5653487.1 hypothetical protein [Gammaproteobacteria bacterium]